MAAIRHEEAEGRRGMIATLYGPLRYVVRTCKVTSPREATDPLYWLVLDCGHKEPRQLLRRVALVKCHGCKKGGFDRGAHVELPPPK